MKRPAFRRRLAPRLAVGLALVAIAAGAYAVSQGAGRSTTYAAQSSLAAALSLGAGLALVCAGLLYAFSRSSNRLGDFAFGAAFGWFAAIYVGWNGGPPLVRTLAMIVAPFTFAVAAHVVLAYPEGRVRGSAARVLVLLLYGEAAAIALGTTLFRDPFFDPACWANCTDNVFLLRSLPNVARAVDAIDRWFRVGAAGAFIALCLWRLLAGSAATRRTMLPIAIPAVLLGASAAAHAIARSVMAPERPSEQVFFVIFVGGSMALILIAAGLVWTSIRTRVQRRAVGRIVARLGETPPPGSLESALREAVGDPDLRIAYWLASGPRLVDANGQPVEEPPAAPGRVSTTLTRDERPIALVSHARRLTDLESELGPAVRLALENERLQAQSLAHLDELQASRTRIVEMGDGERRRIERDLHDGAQQRLLAVSYDIRLARASAETEGDTHVSPILVGALDEARAALDELRELAHGIYPAILEQAGLGPALASLGDTAGLVVSIHGVPEQRYPPPVETTAYLLVAETLADAVRRNAENATVTVAATDQELWITVDDDGTERSSSMTQIVDRVGALGGQVEIHPRVLRAGIPCV